MAPNFKESVVLLLPFFLGVFGYFHFSQYNDLPIFLKICLKCFPITALIGFLWIQPFFCVDEYKCKKIIIRGLILSCVGDAFLVAPNLFIPGMLSFALAHCMYVHALSFQLVEMKYGLVFYGCCIVMLYILMPGLNGPLVYAVPVYSFILVTMGWCSFTVMNRCKMDSWWIATFTGIGGGLWMVSDAILAYNKFIKSIYYPNILIMGTYYLAQLGVTLSSFICWKKYDN